MLCVEKIYPFYSIGDGSVQHVPYDRYSGTIMTPKREREPVISRDSTDVWIKKIRHIQKPKLDEVLGATTFLCLV